MLNDNEKADSKCVLSNNMRGGASVSVFDQPRAFVAYRQRVL